MKTRKKTEKNITVSRRTKGSHQVCCGIVYCFVTLVSDCNTRIACIHINQRSIKARRDSLLKTVLLSITIQY